MLLSIGIQFGLYVYRYIAINHNTVYKIQYKAESKKKNYYKLQKEIFVKLGVLPKILI